VIDMFWAHPILWTIGILVLAVVAFYALAIPFCMIAEEANDNWLVPILVYAGIATFLFFFGGGIWSFVWGIVSGAYNLFMESPWFWFFIIVGAVILLFTRPELLIGALILSGVIFVIYYLATGTAMSIYAFFGWAIAILATTPLAGVPIIFVIIGGYAAGRWMARL